MNVYNPSKLLYHLTLLFLPGMTIELLSGSTPPLNYFNFLTLFFFTICYGMTLTLIRELKVRWNLTWQFMFLFPITGIYIEGLFMQSFFNIAHEDLGILSNFGVFFDVQWPWTVYLILMHGVFSLVVPLMIMDIGWPKFQKAKMLSLKLALFYLLCIMLLTAFQLWVISDKTIPMYRDYDIHWAGTITWFFVICFLITLAYTFRHVQLKVVVPKKAKKSDHFIGLIYMILLLLGTYFFAEIGLIWVLVTQGMLTILLIWFTLKRIYQPRKSLSKLLPYLNGIVLFSAFLAILQGYNMVENIDPTNGMELVGYAAILLLWLLNIHSHRRQKPSETASSPSS